MASPSPLLYNTYYHIYNRGVNGENLFIEERNYDLFLKLYEKHLFAVTDPFAYCMMKNHFHLSVRIRSETIGQGIRKGRIVEARMIMSLYGSRAKPTSLFISCIYPSISL